MGKFKTGDLVRLKSGGPVMTINNYNRSFTDKNKILSTVECDWFDENNARHKQSFEEEQLEKIEKPVPGNAKGDNPIYVG